MISKVLKLQGIGLLHDPLIGHKPLSLGKITVVYGENGRGKSTLAAIFRSFSTGEASAIEERATINGQNIPAVSFLVNNKQLVFAEGKWGRWHPNLAVFDTQFVESNVYSGMSIGPDQRKNLLEFALGEEGVRLAQRVDGLNGDAKTLGDQITAAERDVAILTLGGMSIEAFLQLEQMPEVEREIEGARKLLESLRQSEGILRQTKLRILEVERPSQQQTRNILEASLATVSSFAEASVRVHNETKLRGKGEQWLKKGLEFEVGDQCPYCGQDVSVVGLVNAYSGFFSAEYAALKKGIETHLDACGRLLSEKNYTEFTHVCERNQDLIDFWMSHTNIQPPLSPVPHLVTAWRSLRDVLEDALHKKAASPLEDTGMLEQVTSYFNGFDGAMEHVRAYNASVEAANVRIQEFKDGLERQSTGETEKALNTARNRKTRWSSEGEACCKRLLELRKRKLEVEAEKARAKDEFNQYTKTELITYQQSINDYLQRCGTGFKINDVKSAFGGGVARSDFKINVRASQVGLSELGASSQASPTFRTALSDGDKRTLAFALFVSRLGNSTDIADKIVVFDDPIVSFDAHRRNLCIKTIKQIHNRCAQVIVLTHDPVFAKSLAQELASSDLHSLKIRRHGELSVIEPC